jgi:hypothetical protein
MRINEFQEKPEYMKFIKPVSVQAVNWLNREFEKHGQNERAFMIDKHTVSIEGRIAGIVVDIADHVFDELGGGQYVSSPDDELDDIFEMYGTGSDGFKIYNVDSTVYKSLRGWFPDAHTDFDPKEGTARIFFDDGVTDEIDAKMDRFNSNWQTKSMAIR